MTARVGPSPNPAADLDEQGDLEERHADEGGQQNEAEPRTVTWQHGPASAPGSVGGGNTHLAAVGHGIPRIDDQVEQRPVELGPVQPAWPDLRRQPQLQPDARSGSALQERLQTDEELIDVDDVELEFLLAREREELGAQRAAAFHRGIHLVQDRLQRGVDDTFPEHACADRHYREQIAKVVDDPGGHLTRRVELLSLRELLLYRGALAAALDQEDERGGSEEGDPECAP